MSSPKSAHEGKWIEDMPVITGPGIKLFRFLARHKALGLEIKGLKRSAKGRTAYSICKEVYGLKGSKQSVYDQMEEMIAKINPNNINKIIKTEK